MNIPSYQVKVADVISVRPSSTKSPVFGERIKDENLVNVSWLEKKGPVAKVASLPERKELTENIDEQLVVEYYSR